MICMWQLRVTYRICLFVFAKIQESLHYIYSWKVQEHSHRENDNAGHIFQINM